MFSAFRHIIVDVEKFFKDLSTSAGKFCAAFVKLFKYAPSALAVVENFLGELSPVVVAAVGLADPAVDPVVAAALGTLQTALAGIQAAVSAAASGTSVLTALENLVTEIPSTLTALDVKDAALKAKIEWIANFIVSEGKVLIPAVGAWVKQLSDTPAAQPSQA